ncbi:hypothetical protein [Nonomuraea dietziae]|uniref:hypothetical protein n=1 Tax=Nonomuraea dietziae TaxID=65515 RepID=UPI003409C384
MSEEMVEYARRWLAEDGVVQVGDGSWTSGEEPQERLTANEVAHTWTRLALEDPDLDQDGRLHLALGLLDLLDDYWVTCEIGFVLEGRDPREAGALWAAYRRRLEASRPAEPITYSLWVDWFEDRATAAAAFGEVLGDEVETLRAHGRLDELTVDPLFRRARRVLEISGPVPWETKHPVYQAVAALPELHPALFTGLLGSYHDVYGSLEPEAALALLRRLDLPQDTTHLASLRAVLEAGHRNHYRSPDAWPS